MSDLMAWLPYWTPRSAARTRVVCFPFAGGSASMYRKWGGIEEFEILAVQWPGREGRLRERPFSRVPAMVDAAVHALRPLLSGKPFVVFGHSLGAKVAFEFARTLEREGHPTPRRLFVAGCGAVHLPDRSVQLRDLPDDEFLEALRALGATPDEVLASRELMSQFLPQLRADYTASECYAWRPGPRLRSDICALLGELEPDVDECEFQAWRELTEGQFRAQRFPGGHFFVTDHEELVIGMVREEVRAMSMCRDAPSQTP